jgi:hypothetical protein
MDTGDDIPEDKLLDMPEQALLEGLSGLWAIRSGLQYQRQVDELNRELAGDEARRREQREYEQFFRDISERQDRLLQRMEEEQARIEERRREIDSNALPARRPPRLCRGRKIQGRGGQGAHRHR